MDRIEEVKVRLKGFVLNLEYVIRKKPDADKIAEREIGELAKEINRLYEPQPGQVGLVLCPCVKGEPCAIHPKPGHPSFEERWLEDEAVAKKGDKPQPDQSSRLLADEAIEIIERWQAGNFATRIDDMNPALNLAVKALRNEAHIEARYRQAVKDDRNGKPLDLTEEEFEIYHAIKNLAVVESQARIEALIEETEKMLRNYRNDSPHKMMLAWGKLKATHKREEG